MMLPVGQKRCFFLIYIKPKNIAYQVNNAYFRVAKIEAEEPSLPLRLF